MVGSTKSVGTSTSSMASESGSVTSSPKRTLSPSTKANKSKNISRTVGFLPSYTAAPEDSDPTPTLSYPNKIPFVNSVRKFAGPSAPTIFELDHKTGLTATEREEIIGTLVKMKQAVDGRTELEKTEFSDAQKKFKELLFATENRLTDADREGFINEARRIKGLKNYEEKQQRFREEEEEKRRERQMREEDEEAEANDCYCDPWSIFIKSFQLGMVILIYGENKKLKKDDKTSTTLLILLCFITTIFTACLLIFYLFGRRPVRSMLKTECAYCGFCVIAYLLTSIPQIWRSFHVMLFGFGAMFGYALDIIHMSCLLIKKNMNSQRSLDTDIPEYGNNKVLYSPRRRRSNESNSIYINNHRTDHSTNYSSMAGNAVSAVDHSHNANVTNETVLNLDFLDDDYQEKSVHFYDEGGSENGHKNGHYDGVDHSISRADENIGCHNNNNSDHGVVNVHSFEISDHETYDNHHTSDHHNTLDSDCKSIDHCGSNNNDCGAGDSDRGDSGGGGNDD